MTSPMLGSISKDPPPVIFNKLVDAVKTGVEHEIEDHHLKYESLKDSLNQKSQSSIPGDDDLSIEMAQPQNILNSSASMSKVSTFAQAIRILSVRNAMRNSLIAPLSSSKYMRFQRFIDLQNIRIDDKDLELLRRLCIDMLLPIYMSEHEFDSLTGRYISFSFVDAASLDELKARIKKLFNRDYYEFIRFWKDRSVDMMWQHWLYSDRSISDVPEVIAIQRLSVPDLKEYFSATLVRMKKLVQHQQTREENLSRSLTKNIITLDSLLMNRGVAMREHPTPSFYERLKEAMLSW